MTVHTIKQLRMQQIHTQSSFEGASFEDVAKRLLGLHSTDYWTPYLSVWARIGDYDASRVFSDINSGKNLARINAYRRTLHVVHLEDLPLVIKVNYSPFYNSILTVPPLRKLTDDDLESIKIKIISALDDGPLKMSGLKKRVPELAELGRWIVLLLMAEGRVIRADAKHARSNLTSYALTERWIQGYRPIELSEEEAFREIVYRHVKTYGPVSVDDTSWWLMTTKTRVSDVLSDLESQIDKIEIDGTQYHFCSSNSEMNVETPLIWFLPYEDMFPKAYINRTWYLNDSMKRKLFPESVKYYWPPESPVIPPEKHTGMSAAGEIRPSIWVDGKIIGRWEIEEDEGIFKVITALYERSSENLQDKIIEVKNELQEFINKRLAPISGK